ncbi:MAG: very short patch repair endonuclease, partial [Rhodospirillales bacterium]
MTPEQRSRCMSRIQGKDTKPEVALRKALWSRNHRYRTHYKLPGKPDIVFVSRKLAI